jgi:DNA-directed RNA polymerase
VPNEVPRSFYREVDEALLLRIQQIADDDGSTAADHRRSAAEQWGKLGKPHLAARDAPEGPPCPGEPLRRTERFLASVTWKFILENADRALLKTAAMSDFYGSGAEEKARQVRKWIMAQWFEKDGNAVISSDDDLTDLGGLIRETVEALAPRSMRAKRWITKNAGTLAKQNMPRTLLSASGFPLVNAYQPVCAKPVEVYLDGKRHEFTVATGYGAKFDKGQAITAAAANVTHACDAALLALILNACRDAGITDVVAIHDSIGVHGRHAGQVRKIIREQFRRMYESRDVLKEIRDNAARDLGSDAKLPPPFDKGNLDLTRLTDCEYLTNQ